MAAGKELSEKDWQSIARRFSLGESAVKLADAFGVSRQRIAREMERRGVSRETRAEVRARVQEKLYGVEGADNDEQVEQAINAAATRQVEIIQRHRTEWTEHKGVYDLALKTKDAEVMRFAKLTAETLKIRQDAERKAWSIVEGDGREEERDVLDELMKAAKGNSQSLVVHDA